MPEAARIDLNKAPKEMLAGLFATLGAKSDAADNYADRIIAWRTRNQEVDQEDEAAAYRVAGLAYKPRRAPFESTAELWLVLGLPPVLVEHALPYVTVFSGQAEIDAANAAPTVLAAQPGMTPDRLQQQLARRGAAAQGDGATAQPVAPAPPADPHSTMRITMRIAFDNGRRVGAEVVILLLPDDAEPYRVLSWRDDFDGPA
jgi:general secretion pathway protein K